jgi:hypothetical protein
MDSNQIDFEHHTINTSLKRIGKFVQSKPFRSLLDELYSEPKERRQEFVDEVLLNDSELDKRGVHVPEGVVIQRSAFKDKRPTLFCVTENMPRKSLWEKTTFTFDNEAP